MSQSEQPPPDAAPPSLLPTSGEIARWQMMAGAVLRLVAVIAAVLSVWPLASWLLEGLNDGDLLDFEYYIGRIMVAGTCLVVSALGWLAARPLARRIIPFPVAGRCPRCGFDLAGLRGGRCPECALELAGPTAMIPKGTPLTFARWHSAATLVFRVCAAAALAYGINVAVSWAIWFVAYDDAYLAGEDPEYGWIAVGVAVHLLVGPLVWIIAPVLARLALRGAGPWTEPGNPIEPPAHAGIADPVEPTRRRPDS